MSNSNTRYQPLSASAITNATNSIYAPRSKNCKSLSDSITSDASRLFSPTFFDEELGPPIRPTLTSASFMNAAPDDPRFYEDCGQGYDDFDSNPSMTASAIPGAWGPSAVFSMGLGKSTGHHNSSHNPLYDKLLPDLEPDEYVNSYVDPEHRPYADPAFGVLFVVSFAAMMITGIVLFFTTSGVPVSQIVAGSVYNTLYRSSGLLTFLTILAVGVGVGWIWTMKRFVRPIVYLTVVAIPASCLSLFAVIFTNSILGKFQDNPALGQQYNGSMVWSLVTLAIGSSSGYLLMQKRRQIDQTIYIIELACDVLQSNPSVFLYSLALTGGFIVFSITWFAFFSRLWIVNPESSSTSTYGSNYSSFSVLFFVFMYFWTSSVVQNVQKTMIAGVVAEWWYNPRGRRRVIHYINGIELLGSENADKEVERSKTRKALKVALTTSFGSIVFASLIMAIVTTTQTIVKFLKQRTRNMDRRTSQWLVYALVYCALTASTFCEAAVTCTRLFRRNLVLGLVTSTVTKLILALGVGAIALGTSAWAFFYASRGVGSPYAWIVGILGGIIPYFIVSFLSNIVQNTVDACFIYYLMDLDNDSCHCEPAHRIFGTAMQ
ncbi:hypothetical protein SeLEV6574_g03019 [Synchytrium endobioticum]|uniref:Protein PNS1 n=1 Tax=Synchytrium endobioticum TaxID=286115 RepID=A0A507D229_9FUNG|nr:hypothetical protein SeLEV6574_g03807 [Synchytrium endobioticum]TPX46795.1 hypothetical protein SeLEV6574_g03019 [Synchytrium endobioticum]